MLLLRGVYKCGRLVMVELSRRSSPDREGTLEAGVGKGRRDPGFEEDGMTDGLKALTTRFFSCLSDFFVLQSKI